MSQSPPDIYLATIYRDDIGTGHVYGDRDVDVAYGLGCLIARDKPLRTVFVLTAYTGRLAEAIGPDRYEVGG